MASKYQFQLFNAAANNAPMGPPTQMDAPYTFSAGDFYVFGPNQMSSILKVSHWVSRDSAGNLTFSTGLSLSPPGSNFQAELAGGDDPVVPWPRK